VPCQWLLAAGTGPFHGGAPGDGVDAERLAFQADLRRRDSEISVIELGLNKGKNVFFSEEDVRSTWYVHF
jgi:hypothetical protein